ncbi:Hsp20/alpha crystallin family protein [Clostridium sp.]
MYMPSIFNNSVFDNFDNWMDFSFPSFNQRLYGTSVSQLMKTDVKETDKDYEVSIDLPGFKKEELQIELKDGYLTVSGSKEVSSKEEPKETQKDTKTAEPDASKKDAKADQKPVKYIRQERYSGNVSRSFYVGENLEEKDIHAKFENGTLTLTFPKELEKKAVEEKHFVSIEG